MDKVTRRVSIGNIGNNDGDILPLHNEKENAKLKPKLYTSSKNGGILSKLRLKHLLISFIAWFCLLKYYERIVVKKNIKACDWSNWESFDGVKQTDSVQPYHIALVADPQLIDDSSYPGRPNFIKYFVKKISDNYLHRNYMISNNYLKPDRTIFLGDLFDGGIDLVEDSEKWYKEFGRFKRIFPQFEDINTVMSLPGNHDIGFGDGINITVLNRFETFFGPTNDYINIANHSIILLDTMSLSAYNNDLVNERPKEFIKMITETLGQHPKILLSHVPLYRSPDKQTCGKLREQQKKPFPIMRGKQYQTVLDYELSQELLKNIDPVLIFSGDDHDYCHISHNYILNGENNVVDEISIKSAAMTSGIKYPAVQLLSLYNPENKITDDKPTFQTKICYMPSPYLALNVYVFAITFNILTFLMVLIFPDFTLHYLQKRFNNSSFVKKYELPLNRKRPSIDFGKNFKKFNITTNLKPVDLNIPLEKDIKGFLLNTCILIIGVYLIFGYFFRSI
ncbi:hypothetical protein PACTADRAFT_47729 [Pachysolen tannophilus NRRL Y-2460]|uniref:Calcineurin-like phosphoesterase domain-containing protein n=1 Tax=Pachysolen tannophilus NRRL Y-2460 TaxID=669874 RepID=A0A1E4U1K7_PACTA|nr:hypothetical protein PACTADRAFT_47729 [Pachysolen tannophilus NRRL Y-2460]